MDTRTPGAGGKSELGETALDQRIRTTGIEPTQSQVKQKVFAHRETIVEPFVIEHGPGQGAHLGTAHRRIEIERANAPPIDGQKASRCSSMRGSWERAAMGRLIRHGTMFGLGKRGERSCDKL